MPSYQIAPSYEQQVRDSTLIRANLKQDQDSSLIEKQTKSLPAVPPHFLGEKYNSEIKKMDDELVKYLSYLMQQIPNDIQNKRLKDKAAYVSGSIRWQELFSGESLETNAIYKLSKGIDAREKKNDPHGLSIRFDYTNQIIDKFNVIQEFRAELHNPHLPQVTRLKSFHEALKQEKGKTLLRHRSTSATQTLFRDAYWKRMITNCLAIVTVIPAVCLSIYSRFYSPKKSFNFTTFMADILVDNVKEISKPFAKSKWGL